MKEKFEDMLGRKTLLFIPIILGIYFSWLNRYFYFDDALIYARYIENFINENGLVYNPKVYFNGLTSPLFTYLSILASYLIGNTVFAINFLSGLFLVLSIWILQKNYSNFSNIYILVFSSLLLIGLPFTYSVFGMETFLFIFLINLSIDLFLHKRYKYLFIALALLILTRNEGIFLISALVIEHFRLRRKFPNLKYFIVPILILVSHFTFNYIYYSHFLPETGNAKIWQGMSGLWGTEKPIFITGGHYLFDWVFGGNVFMLYTILILSVLGFYRVGRNSINIIVVLFLLQLLSFYSYLNIPNYHWYNMPFIVFIFFYAGLGLNQLYSLLNKLISYKKIIPLVLILFSSYILYSNFSRLQFGEPSHPYKKIGLWLKNNTDANSSIATVEIGIIGYYSQREIIDILGLVNPYNAKFIGEKRLNAWLGQYKPDYILLHDPIWGHEAGTQEYFSLNNEYLEYTKFKFNGYKLFANKNLDLPKKELVDRFENLRLYRNIINSNNVEKSLLRIEDYKGIDILFSHVGTSFLANNRVLNTMSYDKKINFSFGIKEEAYSGENHSTGACFKIYQNKTKVFEKCLDPKNILEDRGIQKNSVPIDDLNVTYSFEVTPLPNKDGAWGWSFWTFATKDKNESK